MFLFLRICTGFTPSNMRNNTLVRNSYPHVIFEFGNTSFGTRGDDYIEINSASGDGIAGVSYYAKYFFIDNRVELYKECKENKEDSGEVCENTKELYQ